jgi:hypothetical protein
MTNASRTIEEYLSPNLRYLDNLVATCKLVALGSKLRVVYSGAPVVDLRVESRYPHQHRDKVKIHNALVHKWLGTNYPKVLYIDFWNLTADGVNRTSDGFHSVSDINMIKATYILNVMDGMRSEEGAW